MGHRFYAAGQGRFVNRDPIDYDGGINLYGYTGNDPMDRVDPRGTDASTIGKIVIGGGLAVQLFTGAVKYGFNNIANALNPPASAPSQWTDPSPGNLSGQAAEDYASNYSAGGQLNQQIAGGMGDDPPSFNGTNAGLGTVESEEGIAEGGALADGIGAGAVSFVVIGGQVFIIVAGVYALFDLTIWAANGRSESKWRFTYWGSRLGDYIGDKMYGSQMEQYGMPIVLPPRQRRIHVHVCRSK